MIAGAWMLFVVFCPIDDDCSLHYARFDRERDCWHALHELAAAGRARRREIHSADAVHAGGDVMRKFQQAPLGDEQPDRSVRCHDRLDGKPLRMPPASMPAGGRILAALWHLFGDEVPA